MDEANRPQQKFKKTYDPNGYVDVYKTHYSIENGKILGDRVLTYVTPRIAEIDTLEEFDFLEYQICKNPTLASRLFKWGMSSYWEL